MNEIKFQISIMNNNIKDNETFKEKKQSFHKIPKIDNINKNLNDNPLSEEEIHMMMDLVDEKYDFIEEANDNNNNTNNKMNFEKEIINLKKEVNFLKKTYIQLKNYIIEIYNLVLCIKNIKVKRNNDEFNLINVIKELNKEIDEHKELIKDETKLWKEKEFFKNLITKSIPTNNDKVINENNHNNSYDDESELINENKDSSSENENKQTKYNYKFKNAKNYLFIFDDEEKMKNNFENLKSNNETCYMKMVRANNVFGKINLYLIIIFKNKYKLNINSIIGGVFIDFLKRLKLEDEIKNGTIIDEYKAEEN